MFNLHTATRARPDGKMSFLDSLAAGELSSTLSSSLMTEADELLPLDTMLASLAQLWLLRTGPGNSHTPHPSHSPAFRVTPMKKRC